MSDTLDKKLREILLNGTVTFDGDKNRIFRSNDEVIAQIKQAFADEGWLPVKYLSRAESFDLTNDRIYITPTLMPGQEWYDRYETEKGQGSLDNLKDMPHSKDYSDGIDHAVIKCDEAAKRASGLE